MGFEKLLDLPLDELAAALADILANANADTVGALAELLKTRAGDTYSKHEIPKLISRALLQTGEAGIDALVAVLPDAPGSIYPDSILRALWFAAHGQLAPCVLTNEESLPHALRRPIPDRVRQAAFRGIANLIQEATVSQDTFDRLVSFLYLNQAFVPENDEIKSQFRRTLFELFTESSIKLSRQLIEQFEKLIQRREREEVYQRFLEDNPVFLDPLTNHVIPKHRLGAEHVTDFVIQRLDSEYRAVEIEKPQDRIFTQNSAFASTFFHAVGQIIEFQAWLSKNIAYAQNTLPGVTLPVIGILIIGERSELSREEAEKLFTYTQGHSLIEVFTYDDLLIRAKNIYSNILRKTQ